MHSGGAAICVSVPCLAVVAESFVTRTVCNGSSDSTQLYTDVIRISMILRCTLVQ